MSDRPDYLRLHIENEVRSEPPGSAITRFRDSFQQATGWRLQLDRLTAPERQSLDTPTSSPPGSALLSPQEGSPPSVDLPEASSLAEAFAELVAQLDDTRLELQRREAELATGVPVRARRNERQHLAVRLESVLKGGAEAIGCQAAALFLLDDATTQLKLRASWGIPVDRMMQPPRPLRGAVADLEALIGHAVVLEDTTLLPAWKVPEDFPSAVCVPVSSPTEPLGTLWMFCDHVRPYTDEQTNLVEIIAGRVASELQRAALLKECVTSKQVDQQLNRAAEWQQSRLPNVKPLLDDWQFAGVTQCEELLSPGFYDWFVANDGTLAVSIGQSEGSMIESALTTASMQGLLRAHAEHARDASRLMSLVNESFWQASAGGQFASLFFASIDPEAGTIQAASAGHVHADVIGESSHRRLIGLTPPIGTEFGASIELGDDCLQAGEVLIAVSPSVSDHPESSLQPVPYLDAARSSLHKSADEIAAVILAVLQGECADRVDPSWSILVVKHASSAAAS